MNKERIVFMGTSSFSKEVLCALLENNYNIVGVVTQPDRPVGRKKILTPSDVKKVALEHDIPVFQPEKIRKDYQEILDFDADLIITAAYGQIVPKAVLDAPRLGCINCHASLLPKYRGGAPVHYAVMNGDTTTGVTIMYMAVKMDAGDIIKQYTLDIGENEITSDLYDRLSTLAAEGLLDCLPSILNGTNERIVQDQEKVTYSPVITREQEHVSFDDTVQNVHNHIRGLCDWPGCYASYDGCNVKIWKAHIHHCGMFAVKHANDKNGTVVMVSKEGIGVKCHDGVIMITELQVPGKKRMNVKDYLNGKSIFEVGGIFE